MVSLTTPLPRQGGLQTLKQVQIPTSPLPSSLKKRTSSQAGMDADILHPPSSPCKKSKVHFNTDVKILGPEDATLSVDLIRDLVSRALNRHKHLGDSNEYSHIKNAFVDGSASAQSIGLPSRRKLLQALSRLAATLDRSTSDLVSAIIHSDWIIRDAQYVEAFSYFIICLVSARSSWISAIMDMLVEKFSRPFAITPSTTIFEEVSRKEAQQRVHRIVSDIVGLAPLDGPLTLSRAIQKAFPDQLDTTKAHVLYAHNLLKVIDYTPQLEAEILALITDRVVKIDVQVQNEMDELDDVEELLNVDTPETLDSFMDSLEDDEDDSDGDEDIDPNVDVVSEEKAKAVKHDIQKLDVLMDIVFHHYDRAFKAPGVNRVAKFKMLEFQFQRMVLPALRSRHTQFLIFHFAQVSPDYIEAFIGSCMHQALDKSRPSLLRHSSAAYLASFIARGAHIPAQIVRDTFLYISEELAMMRREYEPKCVGPDLRRFSAYYSLFQTLLYIFCFRWKDLESTPSEVGSSPEPYNSATAIQHEEQQHVFIPQIRETFHHNVTSKLNPLKVCSPVIVEEFAKIANYLGIAYIYATLATNTRVRLVDSYRSSLGRETALTARKDEALLQLDEYFPFDPYNLPRSKRWLVGDYRAWEGIPGDDEEEEEETSNSGSESDDDGIDVQGSESSNGEEDD